MGNSSSGFAYDIGERVGGSVHSRAGDSHWHHHSGRKKADGTEVSIFKLDKASTPRTRAEAGQHGFQKMKTMRHPYILQYLDGAEFEKELVMVTEPVKPVKDWFLALSAEGREDRVAWGLRCILSALDFLNSTHGLVHGYVTCDTVFVTAGGDWKLGGLDLVCEWRMNGRDLMHFQTHEAIVPEAYRSPERRGGHLDTMLEGPVGAVDIWGLGAALEELLGAGLKGALASLQRRMLADKMASRPTAAQLLRHSYFTTKDLITTLAFLETFSLKEDSDKVRFFEGLFPKLSNMPSEVGVFKILPVFRDYVRLEGASAQQVAANPSHRGVLLAALPCVLEIAKSLESASFTALAEPLLLPLFDITDRALRAQLLQHLQNIAPKFSDSTLNGRVFENILVGFNDSSPHIRELTLKSIICLTDRLNEKNMNDRLLKCLAKLQQDTEPSIRTNTTIFLGRIAAQLKDSTRVRVLLPAFLKACRDPFPHARLAGLKAAAACSMFFDPVSAATKVIPTIAAALVDPDTAVRDAAFQCHDAYLRLLTANSQKLKQDEERQRTEAAAAPEKDTMFGSESVVSGLASWAANKLTASPSLSSSTAPASAAGTATATQSVLGATKRGGAARVEGGGDGWDDDDFFDTSEGDIHSSAAQSRSRLTSLADQSTQGVGEGPGDGWGLEEDADLLAAADDGMSTKNASMSRGIASTAGVGASYGVEAPRSSGLQLGMATAVRQSNLADDFFSMLDDSSRTKDFRQVSESQSRGPVVSAASGTQAREGLTVASPATAKPPPKARLQARKLSSKTSEKSGWDDDW